MAQTNQINLDIEDDPPNESPNRNIPIQRMDSTSRPQAPRNNIGLGDRLNSVFREIRPLVEHARMVSVILNRLIFRSCSAQTKQFIVQFPYIILLFCRHLSLICGKSYLKFVFLVIG